MVYALPYFVDKVFFKKMGQSQTLFVYFRSFHVTISIQIEKKRRWCAWDSNLGLQNGRRRQNHRAMAATQSLTKFAPIFPPTRGRKIGIWTFHFREMASTNRLIALSPTISLMWQKLLQILPPLWVVLSLSFVKQKLSFLSLKKEKESKRRWWGEEQLTRLKYLLSRKVKEST